MLATTGQEWWTLLQTTHTVIGETQGDLELFIYSERVAPTLLSNIAGLG